MCTQTGDILKLVQNKCWKLFSNETACLIAPIELNYSLERMLMVFDNIKCTVKVDNWEQRILGESQNKTFLKLPDQLRPVCLWQEQEATLPTEPKQKIIFQSKIEIWSYTFLLYCKYCYVFRTENIEKKQITKDNKVAS